MIVINFSHSLTRKQLARIAVLTSESIEGVLQVDSQIDPDQPLIPQVTAMVDQIDLPPDEWQTSSLLVSPPALNFIAVALLAELHGRCGYFPACVRLRPVRGSMPTRYEVAELLDLQALRDSARQRRSEGGGV